MMDKYKSVLINSATKLQYALELRESLNNQWKTTVVISIISAVCGVILICNPFKGAVVIMQIIGGFIVAYSILDIVSTITIKKNVAAIHNAIDGNINDAEVVDEENVETNQTEESKKTDKKDKKSKKKNKKGNANAE